MLRPWILHTPTAVARVRSTLLTARQRGWLGKPQPGRHCSATLFIDVSHQNVHIKHALITSTNVQGCAKKTANRKVLKVRSAIRRNVSLPCISSKATGYSSSLSRSDEKHRISEQELSCRRDSARLASAWSHHITSWSHTMP